MHCVFFGGGRRVTLGGDRVATTPTSYLFPGVGSELFPEVSAS